MKKKIVALTVVGSMLFGGVAGAAGSYYVTKINEYKEGHKTTLTQQYDKRMEEMDQSLHNDAMAIVGYEIERIDKETKAYLNQKLNERAQSKLNEHQDEISAAADQAIADLKAHIDSLENRN